MNIYYIGNGFDIAHNLKTTYLDFKEYFKNHNIEFYERFIELYGLISNLRLDYNKKITYDEDDEDIIELWRDFENTLAKIDFGFLDKKLYERQEAADKTASEFDGIFDPDPAWRNDIYIENMDLYDLYTPLQNIFISWINSIEETQTPCIPKYAPSPLYPINQDDSLFIVFNYTHTLQTLYSIDEDNICYPHGEANSKDYPPQFGHGDNNIADNILNYKIYDEDDRYVIDWFRDYLIKTKKDVSTYLNYVQYFLSSIQDKNITIKIIGCSFSEVDIPYFIQANELFPNAKWEISYYSDKDKERIELFLKENNLIDKLKNENISLICTDDLYNS